jgi:hypothetical protein
VVFYTDQETGDWLSERAEGTELGMSLLCHRIAKAARQSSDGIVPRRRASDAA